MKSSSKNIATSLSILSIPPLFIISLIWSWNTLVLFWIRILNLLQSKFLYLYFFLFHSLFHFHFSLLLYPHLIFNLFLFLSFFLLLTNIYLWQINYHFFLLSFLSIFFSLPINIFILSKKLSNRINHVILS